MADGDALTISGYFFGTSGTLAVDGVALSAADTAAWSDNSITASLSNLGLANGSHVVKVTNPDGAVMQMTFSYSRTLAEGRPLYERTHGVPINDAQFIADKSDRLYGAMVYCKGSLYALAAQGLHFNAQALWRYDTQGGSWSRCTDLPSPCAGSLVTATSLFAYRGDVYLCAANADYKSSARTVWRYDVAGGSWTEVTLANDRNWPDGQLCALGDDLIAVGMSTSDFKTASDSKGSGGQGSYLYADAGEDQGESSDGESAAAICCARIDLDAGTVTKIEGAFDGDVANMSLDNPKVVASAKKIYLYGAKDKYNGNDKVDADWLVRLTYDKANNTMTYENLRSQLTEAIGTDLVPDFEKNTGGQNNSKYIALAGLPDGVAIVGSSTLGEDTHIIKDDSTQVIPYDRTSSYHRAFEPLAAWGDDGYLYVTGTNATEPDLMYFRSTYYGKADPVDPGGGDDDGTKGTPAKPDASPKTGDSLWWVGLAIAAIAALAIVVFSSRKRVWSATKLKRDPRGRGTSCRRA